MVDQNKVPSAADAVKMAETATKTGTAFTETDANGFLVVADKYKLIGRSFVIVATDYDVHEESNAERVHVYAVLTNGKAITFTDTSQGVKRQLETYTGDFPIRVDKGLRVSEYTYNGEKAATFYLDYAV